MEKKIECKFWALSQNKTRSKSLAVVIRHQNSGLESTPVQDLRKCGSFVIFYTSEYSVKSSNSDLTGEVYFLLSQMRANTVFLRCEVNNIFPTLSHSLAWLYFLDKIVLPSTVSRSP